MASLTMFQEPLKGELKDVENALTAALKSASPSFSDMHLHLIKSKGKRLRPMLALLWGAKGDRKTLIDASCAVELIHIASLVHDDVMDSSSIRHGVATLNAKFGDHAAICSGDFLFAQALLMLAKTESTELVAMGANAIRDLCEGQAAQIRSRHNLGLTKEEYTHICAMKTGALFRASCEMGAVLSKKDRNAAATFGEHFGLAFQLVDDWLDVMSTKEMLGKTPGENIRAGELTMPAILLLEKTKGVDRVKILHALKTMDDASLQFLKSALISYGIIDSVKQLLRNHLQKARACIPTAPKELKQSLHSLLDFVEERFSSVSV